MTKPTVIIMRGLPGSGKSTIGKLLETALLHSAGAHLRDPDQGGIVEICSADAFRTSSDGSYQFSKESSGSAHRKCRLRFDHLMSLSVPYIIVDNTNCKRKDFAYYRRQANKAGYEVVELTVGRPTYEPHMEVCAARNTHQVPLTAITEMAKAWKP